MPIQLLPPQLANQIAAGEVVERPASVVKELMENSLDAGATKIELEIEKGGHKRLKIRDNGCGISKEELTLALSRHATSKIASLDDLEHIMSLGFRGEALASISSVSRLKLTSKPAQQAQAWQAHCEGRSMDVQINPAAHPSGTTIDVADLFYNTPARRKFLRTEKTEYQHIEDVVRRIALSHPQVAFQLKHNGKITKRYTVSSSDALTQRISAVMGQKFIANATFIDTAHLGMRIKAWLGNERVLRSSTDCQFSFVNGRAMRDKLILHAIRQAYESVWGVVEQPSFVMYVEVDPKEVDVNVHPAKHEVRFQQSRLVHDFICKTVCDALSDGAEVSPAHEPAPSHDYIRPLTHSEPAEQADTSPRRPLGGQPLQGRSYSSTGPSRSVSEQYSQLMTPHHSDDISPLPALPYLQIAPYSRIYVHKNDCWLLNVASILIPWVVKTVEKANTSQPLLMPVSTAAQGVDEKVGRALNDNQFSVDKVAGKYLLRQVPAGCRHFPWVKWFPDMLSSGQPSLCGMLESVQMESADSLPADIITGVWHDLDNKPLSEQVGVLEGLGIRQSVDKLISGWAVS
ncbi:DNA mismatch repair endonuclease MutL [Alteromonas sp. C1M14]|uniref:DNA mismatch repair endonuclease MutL n=1 Tax=Alteromonas sp. C1M14 TaxID=2841567 RepID=UPI001C093881|nr:DNA mismatch repair endonuclease MutL [Alteromonas sp. C1M14]MBU2980134.1 DNA mismatch repair endonuclease MutL [Alteromonas sp. C1M14]